MRTSSTDGAPGATGARGLLIFLVAAPMLAASLLSAAVPWSTAVSAADEVYPLTLVDDEGTQVTLQAPPQRVISLSPAITETSFALGVGDLLVGRTDWDDYPPEAAGITPVASFTGVDLEQVVALEPDLVLAGGNAFTPPDDVARMRDLGYPVLVLYAPDIPTVLSDIQLLGRALGVPQEAAALTARMRDELDEVAAAVAATQTRPRTFYQVGSEPEIYAPAPDSFLADMIDLAGGQPITTADASAWSISLEELILADPEVILLGDANYGVCPADVAGRPGWDQMSAVVEGRIRPVDDVPVTRPGPRLGQGLASLARAIHPGLELPSFPPDTVLCEAG